MSWHQQNKSFFISEQKYMSSHFPDMHFKVENGFVLLVGTIHISTIINEKEIKDEFFLKIQFPSNYPDMYPAIYEPKHKIPKTFHTNPDNTLCLGTTIEQSQFFFQNASLENFVNNILMPYLIGFLYFQNYGVLPFGERSHGLEGKLEYYKEQFNTKEISSIIKFLLVAERNKLRGHLLCPCGSKKFLRNCHLFSVKKLLTIPKAILRNEIIELKTQSTS